MNRAQNLENQRLLANILGLAEEEAGDLLLQAVQVSWESDDPCGSLLGPLVVQLLRRTFSEVGTTESPRSHACCELVINSAPPCCPMASHVRAHLDPEGFRVGQGIGPVPKVASAPPPVLALLSACFAAAAVANAALVLPAGWVSSTGIRLNFAEWPGVPVGTFNRGVELGACQMVGAGAVGNAIALALSTLPVTGRLTVIDPKIVAEGILNRCLCFDAHDVGASKAERLAGWIETHCPGIAVQPFRGTLQEHRVVRPGEIERLIVGVDSRRARRELQEQMAREVFDASTTGVEEVVFHYNRQLMNRACMACIYTQTAQESLFERHVAEALGVTLEDVQSYLITPEAAARIAAANSQVSVDQLVGRAYDSVFREMCATQRLRTSEERQVLAPFAFVSQLAGTVAAIELFLRCAGAQRTFNYWRVSPWRGTFADLQQDLPARTDCSVCASPPYQALAHRLWRNVQQP